MEKYVASKIYLIKQLRKQAQPTQTDAVYKKWSQFKIAIH